MCACSGCGRRGIGYGWLAFWLLVFYLIFSTPNSVRQLSAMGEESEPSSELCQPSAVNVTKPMSISRTPSYEEDQAMQRLLNEMEEQGRRLPKI